MWWSGMILSRVYLYSHVDKTVQLTSFSVIVGELCNFIAYAFTQAILVTPLGALSVVIRHVFYIFVL